MKIILFLVLMMSVIRSNAQSDSSLYIERQLDALRFHAEHFQPSYVDGRDTVIIARISEPPDSINKFLYYCIDRKVADSYKYAFLVVMRLAEKFVENRSDYDFCYYHNNGVVDLVFNVTGMKRTQIDCYFFQTEQIHLWLDKNRGIYSGYRPLKKQLKRISKLVKHVYNDQ